MRHNCYLIVAFSSVTKLNLTLRCINQLKFAVWQPSDRINIISDILKCLLILSNNFWTKRTFNAPNIHIKTIVLVPIDLILRVHHAWSKLIREGLDLFFSYSVQVWIYLALNIPNYKTGVFHRVMIVTSCKKSWINWVPSHSVAVSRVLHHATRHKNFFNLGTLSHISI